MSINFHPFFREAADRHLSVTVELKNNTQLTGTLQSVDSNLNMHLTEINTAVPQLQGCSQCFVRGSTVKFVTITQEQMSDGLLEDLIHREAIVGK